MRNRSLAWPIVLIGLGVIFLVNNVMPELSLWNVLADWWPVLLIVFGIIRIGEVLLAYSSGRLQTGGIRPMSFGWILAIVFIGLALSIPHHFNHDWHWARAGGVDIFGEEFDYPTTQVAPMGTAKRVILDNLRGNITVTGTDASEVRIEGHKIVRAYDRKAADTANEQSKVTLTTEGDALFVRSTEPSSPDQSRFSLDLEITVPKSAGIEARGRSGDLTINSIDGSVDVSSQRGEIRLQDVSGNAKLDVDRADLVRASNLKGALDIQGKGRDIQLDNINGQVTISGSFSGSLDFRNLAQPLHFESEQTDLRVDKVPGSINMDLGDLRAENLDGFHFVTHSRDVHLEDFSGPVSIELGRGDVDLKPAHGQQMARVDVRSRNGNIDLALPPGGKFDLNATAQQGDVTNDYGDSLTTGTEGRTSTIKSTNPSGSAIVLNTERGEVSIRKLE
jgi:DUF4097 and DUF4098 domain-containing protein YvlB